MCEHILKKNTAHQYNSNSLNSKNQDKANDSLSYRCAAIKNIDPLFCSLNREKGHFSKGPFDLQVVRVVNYYSALTTT